VKALAAALLAVAGAGCSAADAADDSPRWTTVYPLQEQKSFTVEAEGVVAEVTPPPPYPEDREVSDEEFEATYADAKIVVRFPGLPPYEVPRDEYRSSPYGIGVGIGRMGPDDAAPTVLIGGYSGGAHCCATLQVISLLDGRPSSTILPMKDGEPVDSFPQDMDGDGVRDIRWIDGSLLYAFSSYAASWPMPRIYNLREGVPVDVSREARFAPVFEAFARETLAECRSREAERNGACAAYAHAMAVQGRAEEGIRIATSLADANGEVPYDCTVAFVEDQCPEGKERTFADFEDALRWTMRKNGYLP
jgi:hypothetical protein